MVASLVDDITMALDAALRVDLDDRYAGVSDGSLTADLVALHRAVARLEALRARLVGRYDRQRPWRRDGTASVTAAIMRDAKMSFGSARQLVSRARKLASMPATAAALAAGEISTDQVDVLTRASRQWRSARFDEAEAMLVGHARSLRFKAFKTVVDAWCERADAEAADTNAALIDDRRYCDTPTSWADETIVRAALPAVAGAAFRSELHRLERLLYRNDQRTGRQRTVRQRRADALVEMAHRSRATAPGGRRPAPLITILCGEQRFTEMLQLADGTVLTNSQVLPLLGDAEIERIIFDGSSRVIDVSRRPRFTGALRRAIEVRDRHCQHPSGCDTPAADCDVDHVVPRSQGGLTSQDNGRLLCPTHNRHPELRDPPVTSGPPPDTSSEASRAAPDPAEPDPSARRRKRKKRRGGGDGDDGTGDHGGRPSPRAP